MDNLSGLTIGNTTFPVLASGGGGGGGGDKPIHVILPKSASDSTPSGLAMLAWSNGMRYVYCTVKPGAADVTGFIPPEYMGNGSVYISDKAQVVSKTTRNTSSPYYVNNIRLGQNGNTVIGDSTSGAEVTFESGFSDNSTNASLDHIPPAKTSILFFVNPE